MKFSAYVFTECIIKHIGWGVSCYLLDASPISYDHCICAECVNYANKDNCAVGGHWNRFVWHSHFVSEQRSRLKPHEKRNYEQHGKRKVHRILCQF